MADSRHAQDGKRSMTSKEGTGDSPVHMLRRQWKPHKERLKQLAPDQNHPTNIRIHRAFSWLQCVEAIGPGVNDDLALMGQWVAFNALYGRWDAERREPLSDRASWRDFLRRILDLDRDGRLADALQLNRPLVMSILEDQYLSGFFWEEPCPRRANQSKKAMYESQTWYLEDRWLMILERVMERIYLLRCQLMHGAATHGGKLNRDPLRRCVAMLGHLLPAIITVITDHGADEDWGEMCYPPLREVGSEKASTYRH